MTFSAHKKAYIDAAQEYLNKNALGSNVAQYQLPVEKKKGSETKKYWNSEYGKLPNATNY